MTCVGVVDVDRLTAAEPVPLGASAFKAERDAKVLSDARERIAHTLRDACQKAEKLGVECHPVTLEGDPAQQLGLESQRHDLLLLGRRAVPHSDREPEASTTLTEILRHSCRPVVVASEVVSSGSGIVVAYDGSVQAARALQAYVQSGLGFDWPLHLVGIGDQPEKNQGIVGRAVDYLQAHARKAEVHTLPIRGSVASTLSELVKQLSPGLLVMGVYGQPRLKELLFGSVTTRLLDEAPVPLFLHH